MILRRPPLVGLLVFLVMALGAGCRKTVQLAEAPAGATLALEFCIRQDPDLIRLSYYGEPPQFAVWLEDPGSHRVKTVFVTYRSGSGDWAGKTECPAALPVWFEVFKRETNSTGLPSAENSVPDAITGATPVEKGFTATVDVEAGSQWICWVEMNQSADFNDFFKPYDEKRRFVDEHMSGQPPLLYRGEITARIGERVALQLYGQADPNIRSGPIVQPVSDHVTTAKNIFKSIEVRVVPAL